MNNTVLSNENVNIEWLKHVLQYVMSTEQDFFEEEAASFGDDAAKNSIGYRAWVVAKQLGLSDHWYDSIYTQTAADLGFEEE